MPIQAVRACLSVSVLIKKHVMRHGFHSPISLLSCYLSLLLNPLSRTSSAALPSPLPFLRNVWLSRTTLPSSISLSARPDDPTSILPICASRFNAPPFSLVVTPSLALPQRCLPHHTACTLIMIPLHCAALPPLCATSSQSRRVTTTASMLFVGLRSNTTILVIAEPWGHCHGAIASTLGHRESIRWQLDPCTSLRPQLTLAVRSKSGISP